MDTCQINLLPPLPLIVDTVEAVEIIRNVINDIFL